MEKAAPPPAALAQEAQAQPAVETVVQPPPIPVELQSPPPAEPAVALPPAEPPPASPPPVPMVRAGLTEEYHSLAAVVNTLYQQVSEQISASPALSEQCLNLLRDAREALSRGEYSQAEYRAEQVKARLLQARSSAAAEQSTAVRLIWVWLLFVGLAGVVAVLLPFFVSLVPGFVPVLRAVALGALGGVAVSLWNLTRYVGRREYDPAYNWDYFAGPIKGALIGGVVFFLSMLGLVAAPGALGTGRLFDGLSGANLLMYFLALLGGIGQDYVFSLVRRVLGAFFPQAENVPDSGESRGAAE
jgi:hypothetical protein